MMNNCVNEEEVEELRALAQAIQDYESENSWLANLETDAVHEIEFLLDEEDITLDQLLPVFGGMQPFIEFMTRRQNLDSKTLEALVSDLGIDREEIDKAVLQAGRLESHHAGEGRLLRRGSMPHGHRRMARTPTRTQRTTTNKDRQDRAG